MLNEQFFGSYLNRYTMDTIMACAVGLNIDCLNNPDNPFFTKSLLVFKDLEKLKFMFILTSNHLELLQESLFVGC